MKKTLTALVVAGALALGACKYDVHTEKGEHVWCKEQGDYFVTVTDQESRRIGGVLPRDVELVGTSGLWDESSTVAPYKIVGHTDNVLAPNATFTSGRIQYASANAEGCSWGQAASASPCTAVEVKNAQQMLAKYSSFADK